MNASSKAIRKPKKSSLSVVKTDENGELKVQEQLSPHPVVLPTEEESTSNPLKEFAEMAFTISDFSKMVESNFSFKLKRTINDEDELPWDLRVTYYSPRTVEGSKKIAGPLAKLNFGRYFRKHSPGYKQLIVGIGTPLDQKVMIAMFDTDHPHFKNSPENISIKVSGKGVMGEVNSLPICYTFADFFQLKLPAKVNTKAEFYFRVHKMVIRDNTTSGNFVIEQIEIKKPTNEEQQQK